MGNIPAYINGQPLEPTLNGRGASIWSFLSASGGTRLVGPVPARVPLSMMFFGRPFGEPALFRIASAYERATHHREPPTDFGPID
jgi:amidase